MSISFFIFVAYTFVAHYYKKKWRLGVLASVSFSFSPFHYLSVRVSTNQISARPCTRNIDPILVQPYLFIFFCLVSPAAPIGWVAWQFSFPKTSRQMENKLHIGERTVMNYPSVNLWKKGCVQTKSGHSQLAPLIAFFTLIVGLIEMVQILFTHEKTWGILPIPLFTSKYHFNRMVQIRLI